MLRGRLDSAAGVTSPAANTAMDTAQAACLKVDAEAVERAAANGVRTILVAAAACLLVLLAGQRLWVMAYCVRGRHGANLLVDRRSAHRPQKNSVRWWYESRGNLRQRP